jgi:hypothetical protein
LLPVLHHNVPRPVLALHALVNAHVMNALLNLAFSQPLQQALGLVAKVAVIKNAAHLTYMQFYIVIILTHFLMTINVLF